MKKILVMIPARMGSSRFPGKPIIDICGKTMIEHVWQRVKLNQNVTSVFIATCDEEIMECARSFGAEAIMTSDKHERCTDRIAEACRILQDRGVDFDIVLNIQGDEPLLNPDTLDLIINPFLEDEDISCVNLIEKLNGEDEVNSYNNVKAVFDQKGFALYFSRNPLPYGTGHQHYKQLGVYGLTRDAILKYPDMEQTPYEIAESDDMMRFVENRIPVKVILSPYKTFGIDTPEDHEKVISLMKDDKIFNKYRELSL